MSLRSQSRGGPGWREIKDIMSVAPRRRWPSTSQPVFRRRRIKLPRRVTTGEGPRMQDDSGAIHTPDHPGHDLRKPKRRRRGGAENLGPHFDAQTSSEVVGSGDAACEALVMHLGDRDVMTPQRRRNSTACEESRFRSTSSTSFKSEEISKRRFRS